MLTLLLALACSGPSDNPPTEASTPSTTAALTAAPEENLGGLATRPPKDEAKSRRVYFVSPTDGATVTSPVKILMGVEGMEIRPAGQLEDNTGHHHIIIGPAGLPEGQVIPADEKHIHFGAGQTEAEVELPPGEHRLTLQFADGMHVSYGDVMANTITIKVVEE